METRKFILDVETKYKKAIMRALKRLAWVIDAQDGGDYTHCEGYSQIHLETKPHVSINRVDSWGYKSKAAQGFVAAIERDFS